MKVAQSLDILFKDIKFDQDLLKRLIAVNVDYITSNSEIRDMMGSKLLGCYHVSYTQYHKDLFYSELFGFSYDDALSAVKDIKTIPKNFKIARDDINLICFYIAHRFLTSTHLKKEEKNQGAKEILNYFGYRTLVLLNANYWIYPITYEKAVSVSEVLSKNYLITNLKNWNEYVHYRSDAYLNSKYLKLLMTFNRDNDIPNAINDLYNRYKDTVKNIYREFMHLEDTNYIRSNQNVVTDNDGKEIFMDRINDPRMYIDKVLNKMTSPDLFIRNELIELSSSIVSAISQDQLRECLDLTLKYYYSARNRSNNVSEFIKEFITDSIAYLQDRKVFINNRVSIVEIVNMIVGNLLYSRGVDISITAVKNKGEVLMKDIYKRGKVSISSRNLIGMRNIFCVYILILSLT